MTTSAPRPSGLRSRSSSARSTPSRRGDHGLRPHLQRLVQALLAPSRGHHVRAAHAGQGHEHQADGAGADDGHRLAAADPALLHAADHAGQRLHHGRLVEGQAVGQRQQVLPHHPRRDARELRVGAVPEQQVVAQARHLVLAVVAVAAGRGVGGHHRRSPARGLRPRRPPPPPRPRSRGRTPPAARSSWRGSRGGRPWRRCRRSARRASAAGRRRARGAGCPRSRRARLPCRKAPPPSS